MKNPMMRAAAACAAFAFAPHAHPADLPLPRDGWASWQVDAVEDAPAFCCWSSWDDRVADSTVCKLDGDRQGYGTRSNHATTDAVRVYARLANGKLERLRTLSAACPVETRTPIQKLDGVATDDSARWLIGLTRRDDLEQDVLGSLAMHRGALAFDSLKEIARADTRVETRKHAIFWLALVRGTAGAEIATATMFGDPDPEVRKHAAFAITQSKSPRVAPDLIRLGNSDTDADVRAQAWFWLAHTGAADAEQAIIAALRKDPDDHVREQAIFALSQLPDERGTRALIAAAEDRALTREQRKRAVFWLAQSQSPDALKYLDLVLAQGARSPPRGGSAP